MLKYCQSRSTVKYVITPYTHKSFIKNVFTFFSSRIRMIGKNANFGDKKNKKSNFYKNQNVTKIDQIDVNKILVSKEELYVQEIHLNTLSDTMIMMLLDHYA